MYVVVNAAMSVDGKLSTLMAALTTTYMRSVARVDVSVFRSASIRMIPTVECGNDRPDGQLLSGGSVNEES